MTALSLAPLLLASGLTGFSQVLAAEPLNILDYYQRLPKIYRNYYADAFGEPTVESDIPHGYLAITARGWDLPLFEMALFRAANGETILVTSATQSDSVCLQFEGFVLGYKDNTWHQADLLPEIGPKQFYSADTWPEYLPQEMHLRFHPPRLGTVLEVEPNVGCEEPSLEEVLWQGPTLRLEWSAEQGRFTFPSSATAR